MESFAEHSIVFLWKNWFLYIMTSVAIVLALLAGALIVGKVLEPEMVAVVVIALAVHHIWLFYLSKWLRRSSHLAEMPRKLALGFMLHFYLFFIGAPIMFLVGYFSHAVSA